MNILEASLMEREFYPSVQDAVQKIKAEYPDCVIHEMIVHYILFSDDMVKHCHAAEYSLVILCFFTINLRSRFARYISVNNDQDVKLTKETDYDFHLNVTMGKNPGYPVKEKERHYRRKDSNMYKMNHIFMVDLEDYKKEGFSI